MGVESAAESVTIVLDWFIHFVLFSPIIFLPMGVLQYYFITRKISVIKQLIAFPIIIFLAQLAKIFSFQEFNHYLYDLIAILIVVLSITFLPATRWLFKPSWKNSE